MIKDTGTFIICKKIRKIWRKKSENMEKKIRKYGEKNLQFI